MKSYGYGGGLQIAAVVKFVNVDNFKRRFFLGISSRRDVVKAGKAARRSGIQVCQEVMSVWAEYGDAKPSAEKIQKLQGGAWR